MDADGKVVAELAQERHDASSIKLGLKQVELFTYKAADGKTDLYGMLHFPSNFDPDEEVSAAGHRLCRAGTRTAPARRSRMPNALTEYGFLVASLDSRSAARPRQALPRRDLPEARHRRNRRSGGGRQSALASGPTWTRTRVGIFGTSYGGYCVGTVPAAPSRMCSRPRAASSPVTDFGILRHDLHRAVHVDCRRRTRRATTRAAR